MSTDSRSAPPLPYLTAYVASLVGVEVLFALGVFLVFLVYGPTMHGAAPWAMHLLLRALTFLGLGLGFLRLGLFLALVHEATRFAQRRGVMVRSSPLLACLLCLVPVVNVFALYGHLADLVRSSARVPRALDHEATALRGLSVLYAATLAFQSLLFLMPVPEPAAAARFLVGWVLAIPISAVTYLVWKQLGDRLAAYHARPGEGPAFA